MLHYHIDAGDPSATQITFFDPAGEAVHSLRVADPSTVSLVRNQIEQDLLRMDAVEFASKYKIPVGSGEAPAVEAPNANGAWHLYRIDHRKVTVIKGSPRALRWAQRLGGKTVRRTLSIDEALQMGVKLPPDVEAIAGGQRPSFVPEGATVRTGGALEGWAPVKDDGAPAAGDVVRIVDREGNIVARIPVNDETVASVERAMLDDLRRLDLAAFEAKYRILH